MVKRLNLTAQIQKLDQMQRQKAVSADTVLNEREATCKASRANFTPEVQPCPNSLIIEESPSILDTVQNEQCLNRTLFSSDSVQHEQYSKRTVSKMDTVAQKVRVDQPKGNFTQVPNQVLRSAGLFEDPFDFMIYLHLYSYSYGFGRTTADMSQAEIEKFAGVSKNRVKRALERLGKGRWIKLVQEYEHSRVSRKWLVHLPEDRRPEGTRTVSNTDTVQNEQSPSRTLGVSASDSVTVSKLNTNKESIQTKLQTNSLSGLPEELQRYFTKLKPARKRESEWGAFLELKGEYSVHDIAKCLSWVTTRGLQGTNGVAITCHSPMAFLAKAIDRVMGEVRAERGGVDRRKHVNAAVVATRQALEAEAEQKARSWALG